MDTLLAISPSLNLEINVISCSLLAIFANFEAQGVVLYINFGTKNDLCSNETETESAQRLGKTLWAFYF